MVSTICLNLHSKVLACFELTGKGRIFRVFSKKQNPRMSYQQKPTSKKDGRKESLASTEARAQEGCQRPLEG